MRFSLNKLPKKERIRLIGEFYSAMGYIKNKDEARLIFKDLLDGNEIGNLMRRIDIAVLLMLNFNYDEIVDLLNVSRSKISNVQRKLDKSGEGYRLLIKRILEDRKKRKIKMTKKKKQIIRKKEKPEIEQLKSKYPGPFMVWNIIEELGDHFEAKSSVSRDQKTEALDYYNSKNS